MICMTNEYIPEYEDSVKCRIDISSKPNRASFLASITGDLNLMIRLLSTIIEMSGY